MISERISHLTARAIGCDDALVTVAYDKDRRLVTVKIPVGRRLEKAAHEALIDAIDAEVKPWEVVVLDDGFMAQLDAEAEAEARVVAERLPAAMRESYLVGRRDTWEGHKSLHLALTRMHRIAERFGREEGERATHHEYRRAEAQIARGIALTDLPCRCLSMTPDPDRICVLFAPGASP